MSNTISGPGLAQRPPAVRISKSRLLFAYPSSGPNLTAQLSMYQCLSMPTHKCKFQVTCLFLRFLEPTPRGDLLLAQQLPSESRIQHSDRRKAGTNHSSPSNSPTLCPSVTTWNNGVAPPQCLESRSSRNSAIRRPVATARNSGHTSEALIASALNAEDIQREMLETYICGNSLNILRFITIMDSTYGRAQQAHRFHGCQSTLLRNVPPKLDLKSAGPPKALDALNATPAIPHVGGSLT
ncbi:hypothetical protein BD779DRAFT_1475899 [Infundibulicybe gibba]|nr:hypothetical protein BD779DRAFT_1475899 [Infundibulicybe gibba]